jgi:hypothetical protein
MAAQVAQGAFLVHAGLSVGTLEQIVHLALDLSTVDQDHVEFAEGGDDVDLELAVPFLVGMDEVTVDAARLTLHGVDTELQLKSWQAPAGPGGKGTFVCLDGPSRLRRLVIDEAAAVPDVFLVLRAATLSASGAPSAGAPLAATKGFSTGPMLPPPLAALSVSGTGSGRLTLTLPATSGQAWLLQYATGDSLDELDAAAGGPQISSVTVLPAPEDVSLVLQADDGAPEQPLWQHPGAVLPDAADQLADFTPAAGRRLSQALAALNAAGGGAPTLSLPLRFHSARAGTLGVRDRELDVRYLAHPLGTDAVPVSLDGGWQDVVLDAPTRPPASSALRLTARHLGLVVNAGSGVPPTGLPSGGVRVRSGRIVAGRVPWQGPVGESRMLARVRLLAGSVGEAEVVCEVRRDSAGAPGELLAPPAVATVSGSVGPGWVSLRLAAPVSLIGSAALWVTARTNRGELDWFMGGPDEGGTRVSVDGGGSWGDADGRLGVAGAPVTQLLEQVDPALQPPPVVRARVGQTLVGDLALTRGGAPGEYVEPVPAALPAPLLSALASPSADARRQTRVSLWSANLLDMTLTDLTCSYDPFATA